MTIASKYMSVASKQKVQVVADPWLDWLLTRPVLWLGTLLAIVSVADGVRNSILHSLDFQWSPAWLLTRHIDPWATYLSGDPAHNILLNQVPNYLHELYVWMLPFGYLPILPAKLIWAVVNLALVLVSCWCVARLYELERRRAWLLTIFVMTSTPLRVTIGNGQVTALILVALALWAVVASAEGRGWLLGVAWVKYSVPPVLSIFLLLRRRWRLLFCSVLPPLAGISIFLCVAADAVLDVANGTVPLLDEQCFAGAGECNGSSAKLLLRRPPLFQPAPDAFYLSSRGWMDLVPYACGVLLALAIAVYFFMRGQEK